MRAMMFFQMLQKGRRLDHQHRNRHYFEMCRVAIYPSLTEESRKEVWQHYWDQSVTDWELETQQEVKQKLEEKVKPYLPSVEALAFFGSARRH